MTKPMGVVKHADRLVREAEVLFRDKESTMKNDYREIAEGHMQYAKDLREGIEKKSCVALANQAKLYSEQAQKALDAVEKAIEKCK